MGLRESTTSFGFVVNSIKVSKNILRHRILFFCQLIKKPLLIYATLPRLGEPGKARDKCCYKSILPWLIATKVSVTYFIFALQREEASRQDAHFQGPQGRGMLQNGELMKCVVVHQDRISHFLEKWRWWMTREWAQRSPLKMEIVLQIFLQES